MTAKRIHMPHNVIVRSPGLLPMLYRVYELATELGIPERTLRDWLIAGAPFTHDKGEPIWINGKDFATWVVTQRKVKRDRKLKDDQAYCLRCNDVIEIVNPEVIHVKGKLINIKGTCPICGTIINRGGRMPNTPAQNLIARTSATQ
jgi:hypothetical protein